MFVCVCILSNFLYLRVNVALGFIIYALRHVTTIDCLTTAFSTLPTTGVGQSDHGKQKVKEM